MSDRRLSAARLFAWGSPEAIPFARRGLLLVLSAEDSEAVGLGEAAPLAGFSLETLEDGERALRRVPWADVVVPRELDELFAVTAAAAGGARERAARFALETALGSLAAWGRGVSLATFLARREIASAVPRSVLVGRVGEETALERTDRAARAGARSLKLKHSRPDHEATAAFLERVRAVAEAHLGARPALRVDYNAALDVRDVAPALTALARAGVELVEEPCRGAALLELGPFDVPWLADESLVDESLRARLLAHPHVGGFVLKPTLLGGLAVSLRIADVARDRGLPVVVTHAFEGPVGLAACAELALALAGREGQRALAPGVDDHAVSRTFAPAQVAQVRASDGLVRPSGAPGLGPLSIATDPLEEVFAWTRSR